MEKWKNTFRFLVFTECFMDFLFSPESFLYAQFVGRLG